MKKKIIMFISDLLVAALLLGGTYVVQYQIPQEGVAAQMMTAVGSEGLQSETEESNTSENSASVMASDQIRSREQALQAAMDHNLRGIPVTKVSLDSQDWHEKFADKFTDQVISTDTSYSSPNVSKSEAKRS